MPPTDSRLRGDLRAWDRADLDTAISEKNRLEDNQRARRVQVKNMLAKETKTPQGWIIDDERTFYNP